MLAACCCAPRLRVRHRREHARTARLSVARLRGAAEGAGARVCARGHRGGRVRAAHRPGRGAPPRSARLYPALPYTRLRSPPAHPLLCTLSAPHAHAPGRAARTVCGRAEARRAAPRAAAPTEGAGLSLRARRVQTGVLSGLLRSEEDRKEAVQEGAEQGQPVTVDGSPAAGPTPDGSSELPHGQPAAGGARPGGAAGARPGGAAGEGRAGEAGGAGEPKLTTSLSMRTGRDRVGDVAETGAAETTGEAVGTIIQKNVDTKARPWGLSDGGAAECSGAPGVAGAGGGRLRAPVAAGTRLRRPGCLPTRGAVLTARARARRAGTWC